MKLFEVFVPKTGYSFKDLCTKAKVGKIYRKRKIDVELFFRFLKAYLGFTRLSVRGESKAHNELGRALMAVNLRKFTAINL